MRVAVVVGMATRDAADHMTTDLPTAEGVAVVMVTAAQEASPVAIVSR